MIELNYDEVFSYTNYINSHIKDFFSLKKQGVIFGQNIISGSRISGLGKDLENIPDVKAINTTNSENSLMGLGLGLSLGGTPSMFIMKQHDFALLGLDQLTNSVNLIQHFGFRESFIIIMVVVDSGFEGPQASLNNLDEFVSLSRQPVYFLNSKQNIENAFNEARKPGLHMMVLSQKHMKSPILNLPNGVLNSANSLLDNSVKSKNLLIYTGFDTEFIEQLLLRAESLGTTFDLFLNCQIPFQDSYYGECSPQEYLRIAYIQDTKSLFTASHTEALKITTKNNDVRVFTRVPNKSWSSVYHDIPEYTAEEVIRYVTQE